MIARFTASPNCNQPGGKPGSLPVQVRTPKVVGKDAETKGFGDSSLRICFAYWGAAWTRRLSRIQKLNHLTSRRDGAMEMLA